MKVARSQGVLLVAVLTLSPAPGQLTAAPASPPASFPPSPPAISLTVTSRLVVVPTLVRSATGDLVHSLAASDFTLLDNGLPQQLSLEADENVNDPQPLALVVVLQTGGAAREHFADYAKLPTMVGYMTSGRAAQVALVTFDSQPEDEWDFTSNLDDLKDGLSAPEPGDHGAAVLAAVDHAIGMLQGQPAKVRRVVLLLSQASDEGSKVPVADVVRRLGESNITVFSVSFSPEKAWLKHQFTQPRSGEKPYVMSPDHAPILYTFSLSTPLGVALRAMRTKSAVEIASLSGGQSASFDGRLSLERQLAALANDLPNRYLLSFRPSSALAGFHALQLRVATHPEFHVSARAGYWATGLPSTPEVPPVP